jgi:hypothetical protein
LPPIVIPSVARDPASAVVSHKVDCLTSSEKGRSFAVFAAQDDNAGSGVAPIVIPSVARDPSKTPASRNFREDDL